MKEMDLKHYRINTDTTRFLLPLLGYDKDTIINKDFINAYLHENHNIALTTIIVLIYKTPNKLLEGVKFKQKEDLIYYYFTFNAKAYELFLKGKYSKFSLEHKSMIIDFWGVPKNSRLSNILNPKDFVLETTLYIPTPLIQEKEIWPKPNPFKEIFIPKLENK